MAYDYIKQGDCLELMKEIPDKSVDMILCDLPFAETGNSWDKSLDLVKLFDEYRRIIKEEGCIALNGTFKFGAQLYNIAPDLYKYDWVWEKEHGTNVRNINHQPFRTHEFIFIFGKGGVSPNSQIHMVYNPQKTKGKPYAQKSGRVSTNWKGSLNNIVTTNESGDRHPKTIQRFSRDKEKYHPTQKPIRLCEYLIKTYTNEGGIVLDNCMGSGTTCVAAINTGRHYIGFEKEEKYFKIAEQRIKEAYERGVQQELW